MKNKSKKPLVITSLIVLILVISIIVIFYARETDKNKLLNVNHESNTQNVEKDEDTQTNSEDVQENESVNKEDDSKIKEEVESKKEETSANQNQNNTGNESKQETHQTNTSNSNTSKKEENKPNTNTQTPTNTENTNNNSNQNVKLTESESPKQEPPKSSGIWDIYGKTEYEYYNEPMYDWERVDFSISKYGTMKGAYQACVNYGSTYEPYLNGEELFNCNSVLTASGKELGVMFVPEKLR